MSNLEGILHRYQSAMVRVLPLLAGLLLGTALVSRSGGQPVAAIMVLLCLPLLFVKRQVLQRPNKWLIFALTLPLLTSIPLFLGSATGEALAPAARFFLAGLVLLALGNIRFDPQLLMRSATAGGIVAVLAHIGELGQLRVNWGVGYIDSGYVAVMLLCLSLGQFHLDKGKIGWRLFALLGIGCLFLAVLKTGTRGAWPAMIIVFLLQFLFLEFSRRQKVLVAGFGLALFATSAMLVPSIKERIDLTIYEVESYAVDSNRASSMGYRLDFWRIALRCFEENPLWGVSYQKRSEVMKEYTKAWPISSTIGDDGRSSSHNEFLEAMAKRGILGVIAVLLLYLIPMRGFIRRLHTNHDPTTRVVCHVGVALVVTMILTGITEAPLMNVRVGTTYGFMLVFLYQILASRKKELLA